MMTFSCRVGSRFVSSLLTVLLLSSTSQAKEPFLPSDLDYLSRVQAEKSKYEKRTFRTFTLENGLEVLLVQDPAAKQSAAAVNVGIGFFQDPAKFPGTAHFMEHMLFLGSEKYPIPASYDDYLKANGGSSNANTTEEDTNFYFVVNSSAFSQALDRFAQFFIHPLFDQGYLEKELQAVDSEYLLDFNQAPFRSGHLKTKLANRAHPQSRVFQGDAKSLRGIPKQEMERFFKRYYSTNLMKLAVISPLSLDATESMVRETFSGLINRNTKLPKISADVEDPRSLPRLIQMKSTGEDDESVLELSFSLPAYQVYQLSTPQTLISNLISYAGAGSLSQDLKKDGLIESMFAIPSSDRFRSELIVYFQLTKSGLPRVEEIAARFFNYVAKIKKTGMSPEVFASFQRNAELQYIFGTPENDEGKASNLARDMQTMSPLEIERLNELQVRYSPEAFDLVAGLITPARMQAFLQGPHVYTDSHEERFAIDYSVKKLNPKTLEKKIKAWSQLESALPGVNSWLPTELGTTGETDKTPREILSDGVSQLWIKKDYDFQKPHANVSLNVQIKTAQTAKEKALQKLLLHIASEVLSTWGVPAEEAGLHVELAETELGFALNFRGFYEKLQPFAEEAIQQIGSLNLTQEQFQTILEEVASSLGQSGEDIGEKLDQATRVGQISDEAVAKALAKINLSDLQEYSKTFLSQVFIQALGFGHIEDDVLKAIVSRFISTYGSQELPAKERPDFERSLIGKGTTENLVLQVAGETSTWIARFLFGTSTDKRLAALKLGEAYFGNSFYNYMRTEKTLGYSVASFSSQDTMLCGMNFLVGSPHPLSTVISTAEPWIKEKNAEFSTISDADFEALRTGALESMEQGATSYDELWNELKTGAFEHNGDWRWRINQIKALKTISKKETLRIWNKAFATKTSRRYTLAALSENALSKKSSKHLKKTKGVAAKLALKLERRTL